MRLSLLDMTETEIIKSMYTRQENYVQRIRFNNSYGYALYRMGEEPMQWRTDEPLDFVQQSGVEIDLRYLDHHDKSHEFPLRIEMARPVPYQRSHGDFVLPVQVTPPDALESYETTVKLSKLRPELRKRLQFRVCGQLTVNNQTMFVTLLGTPDDFGVSLPVQLRKASIS